MILPANPKAGYLAYKEEIDAAVARVLASGWYLLGQELQQFEAAFAAYLGVGHAVGVANGTDAIELALRAVGVGCGDVVLTVSHTAVATVAAIERCGATPGLVDIEPVTYNMDPAKLETALKKTKPAVKAVVPVHLYGQPAEMDAINKIAGQYGLFVIEDCAQAHGAMIGSRKVGSFGHLAAFSFYPTKNLGALGDGGCVVSGDAKLADRVRSLREYGWQERYVSAQPGVNSRLDELQAAVLTVKLAHLDKETARRQAIAQLYHQALAEVDLVLPQQADRCTHVYHQYVVRTDRRDQLKQFLQDRAVGSSIHYPVPIHHQPAYAQRLASVGPLDQTEQAAKQVLSLPIYPQLSDDEVAEVARQICAWSKTTTSDAVEVR